MFVQSQNITRKKAFIGKRGPKNVDEIDHRGLGHVWFI